MGGLREPKTLVILAVVVVGVGLMTLFGSGATGAAGSEAAQLLLLSAILYLIPSAVAFSRDHPQKMPILALNILLGWTLVGWVAALVWGLTRSTPPVVAPSPTKAAEIAQLAALRERGHLTDEEFDAEKARILRN